MDYLKESLAPGEKVLFQTRLHWVVQVAPGLILLFWVGIALLAASGGAGGVAICLAAALAGGRASRLERVVEPNEAMCQAYGITAEASNDAAVTGPPCVAVSPQSATGWGVTSR